MWLERDNARLTPRQQMALGITCSLVLHGLVLVPLALNLTGRTPENLTGPQQTPIYVDIRPRPRFTVDPEPVTEPTPRAALPSNNTVSGPTREGSAESVPPEPERGRGPSQTALATDRGRWQVRPAITDRQLTPMPPADALGCRARTHRLNSVDEARCDQIFAEAAARGGPISGSGNPARDSQFAAIGDRALADYDRRRAPLNPNSRANPCPESPNRGDPCAFTVKGRIWSSRDGWLPDLPGRQ